MDVHRKSDLSANNIMSVNKSANNFQRLKFCCTLVRRYGYGIEDLFTACHDETVKKELRGKLENDFNQVQITEYSEYPTVAAHLILEYLKEMPGSLFSEKVLLQLQATKNFKHEELLPYMKHCFKFMDEETFIINKYVFSFFNDFVRSTSSIHMNLYRIHQLLAAAIFAIEDDQTPNMVQKQIMILCIREYDSLFKPSIMKRIRKMIPNLLICAKKQ